MRKSVVVILLGAIAFGLLATSAASTAVAESNPPAPSDIDAPTPTPENETLSQMIRRVRPSVVGVSEGVNIWGTGFIFRTVDEGPDKGAAYIMTNFHVIEEISDLRVLVEDTAYRQATIVSTDPRRDLAMLRICCSSKWKALEFKDSTDMYPGDEVIAIGYAKASILGPHKFRLERKIVHGAATVTRGIISAFRYDQGRDAQVIQHDAPINHGNSGGPLFSRDGRVVAVNTYILRQTEGMGFAVLETTVQERIRLWDLGPSASFGPLAGNLQHKLDNRVKSFSPKFQATGDEFTVRATFTNPYSAEQNLWDYGFAFGYGGESDDSVSYFVVDSNSEWLVRTRTLSDGEFHETHEGPAPQLLTGKGQKNVLELWVDGPYAWILVNGQKVLEVWEDLEYPVGAIDLGPGSSHEGKVWVITGFWTGSERRGAVTRYEDFAGLTYDHSR